MGGLFMMTWLGIWTADQLGYLAMQGGWRSFLPLGIGVTLFTPDAARFLGELAVRLRGGGK